MDVQVELQPSSFAEPIEVSNDKPRGSEVHGYEYEHDLTNDSEQVHLRNDESLNNFLQQAEDAQMEVGLNDTNLMKEGEGHINSICSLGPE
jgi:hypothetical protein